MPGCKCCSSPYLDFINTLLLRGEKPREISKRLKEEYDISISHMSVWRHYKNHLLPSLQRAPYNPLRELDRLGQSRLKRAIYRGIKILKTRPRCSCRSPTSFRRRGIAYICKDCGGWVPANLARAIKRKLRREKQKQSDKIVQAVRVKRRHFL